MRKWTQDYKQFLEGLLPGAEDSRSKATGKAGAKKGSTRGEGDAERADKAPTRHIKDFKENHTDTT